MLIRCNGLEANVNIMTRKRRQILVWRAHAPLVTQSKCIGPEIDKDLHMPFCGARYGWTSILARMSVVLNTNSFSYCIL